MATKMFSVYRLKAVMSVFANSQTFWTSHAPNVIFEHTVCPHSNLYRWSLYSHRSRNMPHSNLPIVFVFLQKQNVYAPLKPADCLCIFTETEICPTQTCRLSLYFYRSRNMPHSNLPIVFVFLQKQNVYAPLKPADCLCIFTETEICPTQTCRLPLYSYRSRNMPHSNLPIAFVFLQKQRQKSETSRVMSTSPDKQCGLIWYYLLTRANHQVHTIFWHGTVF